MSKRDFMYTASPSSPSSTSTPTLTSSRSRTSTTKGWHEFMITGYSLAKGIGIGKYVASDTFMVGGHAWQIYFYPDGKCISDNTMHVSLFIALASDAYDVRALFELTLMDQSWKGNHKVHSHFDKTLASGPYTLKYRGSMWGFKRFFNRDSLEKSDYLKDDCLHVRCCVGVIKSETHSIPVSVSDVLRFFERETMLPGADVDAATNARDIEAPVSREDSHDGTAMEIDEEGGRGNKKLKLESGVNQAGMSNALQGGGIGVNNRQVIATDMGSNQPRSVRLGRLGRFGFIRRARTSMLQQSPASGMINKQRPVGLGLSQGNQQALGVGMNNEQPMTSGMSDQPVFNSRNDMLTQQAVQQARSMAMNMMERMVTREREALARVKVKGESSDSTLDNNQDREHPTNPVQAENMMNEPKVERPDNPDLLQNAVPEQRDVISLPKSEAGDQSNDNQQRSNLSIVHAEPEKANPGNPKTDASLEEDYITVQPEETCSSNAPDVPVLPRKEDN